LRSHIALALSNHGSQEADVKILNKYSDESVTVDLEQWVKNDVPCAVSIGAASQDQPGAADSDFAVELAGVSIETRKLLARRYP
jgi:hypothetical protein